MFVLDLILYFLVIFLAVAYHTSRGRPSRNSDVELDDDPSISSPIPHQHHQHQSMRERDYDTHRESYHYPRDSRREFHDHPQQLHYVNSSHSQQEEWDDVRDVVSSRVLQRHHSRDSDYTAPSPHRTIRRTPANPL